MWKMIGRTSVACLALAGASFAQSETGVVTTNVRYVGGSLVNLRQAPNENAALVAALPINTSVSLTAPATDKWCAVQVIDQPSVQGHMMCAYLRAQAYTVEEAKAWVAGVPELLEYEEDSGDEESPRFTATQVKQHKKALERAFFFSPSLEILQRYGQLLVNARGRYVPAEYAIGTDLIFEQMKSTLQAGIEGGRYRSWMAADRLIPPHLLALTDADRAELKAARFVLPPVVPSLFKRPDEVVTLVAGPFARRTRGSGGSSSLAWSLPGDQLLAVFELSKAVPGTRIQMEFVRPGANATARIWDIGAYSARFAVSPPLLALTTAGVSPAQLIKVDKRLCGGYDERYEVNVAGVSAPPLVALVSTQAIDGRATVKSLPTGKSSGQGWSIKAAWTFDLNADASPDVLVLQTRQPAAHSRGGLIEPGQELGMMVMVNVDGQWLIGGRYLEGQGVCTPEA